MLGGLQLVHCCEVIIEFPSTVGNLAALAPRAAESTGRCPVLQVPNFH